MDLPLLYPIPRHLERLPGTVPADALVHRMLDAAIAGDEAYRLVLRDGLIELRARTETGLRWAEATLAQIRAQCPRELPCLAIDDAPAFAHRGFMLDISRDRVPTLTTLTELVDLIASLKGNRLQLYVEHTLAYAGHDDAWREASPLSLDELEALGRYAAIRGVTIDANQNCLGHFERWLKHPRYAPLGELPAPTEIDLPWGRHLTQPNTLCPLDPHSGALVGDLLAQQMPRCPGEFVNIGCDEPWDLGHGRSRDACAAETRQRVLSRWVSDVAARVRAAGRTPMYWCDPHPNEDDGLPRDLIALVWGYEHDEDFATRTAAHRAVGRRVWVCPGTGCWNSVTGRTWYRRANLAQAAAERRAEGFLLTAWGDGGHHQQWPVTLLGLADGLQAAWSGGGTFSDDAAGAVVFGDPTVGRWLAALGDADEPLTRKTRNVNAVVHDFRAAWGDATHLDDLPAWEGIARRLATLAADAPSGPWGDECRNSVELARWCAERAVLRRSGGSRTQLAARFPDLVESHRRLWLRRCRPGGLRDSTNALEHHAGR